VPPLPTKGRAEYHPAVVKTSLALLPAFCSELNVLEITWPRCMPASPPPFAATNVRPSTCGSFSSLIAFLTCEASAFASPLSCDHGARAEVRLSSSASRLLPFGEQSSSDSRLLPFGDQTALPDGENFGDGLLSSPSPKCLGDPANGSQSSSSPGLRRSCLSLGRVSLPFANTEFSGDIFWLVPLIGDASGDDPDDASDSNLLKRCVHACVRVCQQII
jgi:hypothetical protein